MRASSLWIVAGVVGLVACTAGTGPSGPASSTKEPAPGGEEPGTSGNEPTGGGPESPVSGGSSGGGTSSSGGGSKGDCLDCAAYDCTASVSVGGGSVTVNLSQSTNGACSILGFGVTLACNGAVLFSDGGVAGSTWTATSGGGFSVTVGGDSLTCTPQ